MEAPDLAAPIAGWRLWLLGCDAGGPVLVSPVATATWPARVATTASCRVGCEQAPAWDCRCGLYATAHLDELLAAGLTAGLVLGCAALWGRVVEATEGWRAERGYPLVLVAPTTGAEDLRVARAALNTLVQRRPPGPPVIEHPDERVLEALARRYAVPVHAVPAVLPRPGPEAATIAAAVRDEAVWGLAARRRGDGHARQRFARVTDDLLAVLRPPDRPTEPPPLTA